MLAGNRMNAPSGNSAISLPRRLPPFYLDDDDRSPATLLMHDK
jgi:hypothetical protein